MQVSVIPAQAGIQKMRVYKCKSNGWIPGCTGMTILVLLGVLRVLGGKAFPFW
jgi:hypothetical protein